MTAGKLTTGEQARTFLLGGNAYVTLVSVKTGVRFTYRVKVSGGRPSKDAAPEPPWFVSLLTGRDNNSDYTTLGTIFADQNYRHNVRKSRVPTDAPSALGFAWAWSFISRGELPPACEVWHEGRCGRCGRRLSVPSSIEIGLGPECAGD